jgi:hypothetical protein
MNLMELDALI